MWVHALALLPCCRPRPCCHRVWWCRCSCTRTVIAVSLSSRPRHSIVLAMPCHAMGAVVHASASPSSPHCGRRCCGADTVPPSSSSRASHLIGVDGTAGGDVIVVTCVATRQLDRAMGGASLSSRMSQRTNWRVAVARAWCRRGAVIVVVARVITGAQTLWAAQWAASANGWGPCEEAGGARGWGWHEWMGGHANGREWTGRGGGCSEQVKRNST